MYGCQSILLSANATTNTRSRPANAAAFTAEAMNATVGRRRALVHVRQPGVERDGGDLEAEPDEQQREPGQQEGGRTVAQQLRVDRARHRADRRGELGDAAQVRRAGRSVHERDAVEEEGRRERAEHEVLHAGFLRLGPPQMHRREHVRGDRQDLEAEEHDDQVVGRRHDHAARRRQQDEDVQLGAVETFAAQVAVGQHRRQHDGGTDHEREEDGEAVDRDRARDRRERPAVRIGDLPPQRDRRGHRDEAGQRRSRRRRRRAATDVATWPTRRA